MPAVVASCGYHAMSAVLCSLRNVSDFVACDAMVNPSSCSGDSAFVVVSACGLSSSWSPAPDAAELL